METSFKIPFYARAALIFISAFAFVFTLHIGRDIILPILYATIIAILLNPLVNYLMRKRIHKLIAISFAVALAIFVAIGFLYILSTQLSMFSETYPQLKQKFNATSTALVQWISDKFNIRVSRINAWTKETQSEAISEFAIGDTLLEAGEMIMVSMLLPVYLFMILYLYFVTTK